MRFFVFTALWLGLFLAVFPVSVQAELDCTDFLTFSYPGNAKLPADAFDYNTSIRVLRIASGRVDSFTFSEATQGYFLAALGAYAPRNVTAGDVLYQYTQGRSEFYYRVFNGTSVPWYCSLEKMADLTVGAQDLSGTFYTASGQKLDAAAVSVVTLDAGIDHGFLVPGFGTTRKVYVASQDNVPGIAVGYVVHDAGNGTYVATGYKQARFHVPANATPFCNDWGSVCLDASGTHAQACIGSGFHSYFCNANVCVTNMTACPFGCENAACVESKPSPTSTPSVSAIPSATVAVSSTPLPAVSATASATATPARSGGFEPIAAVVILLALLAGGYHFLFAKRRPKGL